MNKDTFTKYTRIKSYVDPGIDRRHYVQHNHGSVRDVLPSNWQATRLHFWIWHAVHLFAYNSCPGISLLPLYIWICVCACTYTYHVLNVYICVCVCVTVTRSLHKSTCLFSRYETPERVSADLCTFSQRGNRRQLIQLKVAPIKNYKRHRASE